jgi:Lysylphosphatidylglycerol synthase TM region
VLERVADVVHVITGFAAVVGENVVDVDPRWLLGGLLLQLAADAVRNRGWFNIVCAAFPGRRSLRMRDLLVAYFAGAGLGAFVPARGGDVVKLALLRRRIPGARVTTLAATLVPESLFESLAGAALVAWALRCGYLPAAPVAEFVPTLPARAIAHPLAAGALGLAATAALVCVRRLAPRLQPIVAGVRRGLAILSDPASFVVHVASWQALGRVIRLAALACYAAAFHLAPTPALVLTVMTVDGAARVRLGPFGTALGVTLYAYALPAASGGSVSAAQAIGFAVGLRVFTASAGLAISVAVLAALALPAARRPTLTLEPAPHQAAAGSGRDA